MVWGSSITARCAADSVGVAMRPLWIGVLRGPLLPNKRMQLTALQV